jgi:hypothetical protein
MKVGYTFNDECIKLSIWQANLNNLIQALSIEPFVPSHR